MRSSLTLSVPFLILGEEVARVKSQVERLQQLVASRREEAQRDRQQLCQVTDQGLD